MAAKGKKQASFPAWHPDFRITDDLPDIKVVRTDFLINIGSVVLALALLFMIVGREATIQSLNGDQASLQAEEKRLSPENSKALRLNKEFLEEKRTLDDLEKFFDVPLEIPQFIADIGRIKPANIMFNEIAYQEIETKTKKGVSRSYRIFLRGETKELSEIDLLKDTLVELPYLSEVGPSIDEGSNPRNAATDTFGFSIEIRFTPAKG